MRLDTPLLCCALSVLVACSEPPSDTSVGASEDTSRGDGDDASSRDGAQSIDTEEDGESRDGEDGEDGTSASDGDPVEPTDGKCGVLKAVVRDFTPTHPDFESAAFTATSEAEAMMAVTGLMETRLGSDKKPVFKSAGVPRAQLTSAAEFAKWYNDVAGVNQAIDVELELVKDPTGQWVYDNAAFFPIDGMGFGNYAPFANGLHNFHFTTELHLKFTYEAGQKFTFRGDDDLWLFVADELALDLGGLHLPVSGTLDMDAVAAARGISPGETVDMDIFHAERHTEQSNFRIETNIECLVVVL